MHCNQKNKSAITKLNHWLEQTLLFDGVTHFAFTYYSRKINSYYAPKYCFTSKAYRGWNRYYQEEKLDNKTKEVIRTAGIDNGVKVEIVWDPGIEGQVYREGGAVRAICEDAVESWPAEEHSLS